MNQVVGIPLDGLTTAQRQVAEKRLADTVHTAEADLVGFEGSFSIKVLDVVPGEQANELVTIGEMDLPVPPDVQQVWRDEIRDVNQVYEGRTRSARKYIHELEALPAGKSGPIIDDQKRNVRRLEAERQLKLVAAKKSHVAPKAIIHLSGPKPELIRWRAGQEKHIDKARVSNVILHSWDRQQNDADFATWHCVGGADVDMTLINVGRN